MGILCPFLGLLLSPQIAAATMAFRSHHRHQADSLWFFQAKKEKVMTADRWFVLVAGLALIADTSWFFWLKRSTGARAAQVSGGYQEALILLKGGYTPASIVVRAGKPVRLSFRPEETA